MLRHPSELRHHAHPRPTPGARRRPMIAARLLDVLLVLILLVYLGEGWRNGFVRSLSAILGVLAGGVAAFFAVPVVAALIPSPFWRLAISIGLSIALLIAGHAGGVAIARAIRGRRSKDP